MPGAADALQRHRDGARRADLADQVHRADIDAQFERSGGHHGAQFAVLEALLGVQAQRARQAAVMRQDDVLAQALLQVMRHALGQAARVDEDQRGAILADQVGQAVVDLAPHFVAGHGAQFVARHFHRHFHGAAMAHVDDAGMVAQECRDFLDGLDGGGKADALRPRESALLHQAVQARQRERQVRAALIVRHGVDFVHDQGAHLRQHLARLRGGQQNVERFRRGDQDVRPFARHPLALPLRRVAGAQRGADGREFHAALHAPGRRSPPAALPGSCGRRC